MDNRARRANDDPPEVGQPGYEYVGEPYAEVLLSRLRAKQTEWQDRKRPHPLGAEERVSGCRKRIGRFYLFFGDDAHFGAPDNEFFALKLPDAHDKSISTLRQSLYVLRVNRISAQEFS